MNRIKQVVARSERGATAVVVAFSLMFVFAAGALGMDIAKLAYARQQVRAAIDAGAQAGAFALPNVATARSEAIAFAAANSNGLDVPLALTAANVKFYCVVGVDAGGSPKTSQVSSMCGSAAVTSTVGMICNGAVCALPCDVACNTLSITDDENVLYNFAPAIGINSGRTGAQTTASCRGACGTVSSNPMDVVIMADRTPSMGTSLVGSLKTGIQNMLGVMNSKQQYVALGTIAKSRTGASCLTAPLNVAATYSYNNNTGYHYTGSNPFPGKWVPVPFSADYSTVANDGTITVNGSSVLYKSAGCMTMDDNNLGWTTYLSAAMKGAAQYLYGSELGSSNNLASLPDRSAYGTPKKVIIFETDGAPTEYFDSGTYTNLFSTNDPSGGSTVAGDPNYPAACQNLLNAARDVKNMHDALIITIGYGSAVTNTSNTCGASIGTTGDLLAATASDKSTGGASDNGGCASPQARTNENIDGDNYFCAATAAELQGVFAAAIGQVNGNTKFMKIGTLGS
jgi:hypothetical protein